MNCYICFTEGAMTNVIDLNTHLAAHTRGVDDADDADASAELLAHLANTADAMRYMLQLSAEAVTAGALEDARRYLALAATAMLGPGWAVQSTR
jgi:hypothetical protein